MEIMKKAYVFDFDETLVMTKARIHVYKNDVHVKEMNSKEYNFYKHEPGEKLDFSEFNDPELILNAKKYKMWPVIKNVNNAIQQNRSTSDIYILTARSAIVKSAIYEFLKKNGIHVNIQHIITIGDDKGDINISKEKHKWLTRMTKKYNEIIFFDDDPKNIQMASDIKGIRTRLVEDMGGVGAPMATLTNTPGMGTAVPASSNGIGSGDKWGNTIGGKPYTQEKPLKKKRKKKKIVKESFKEKSDPVKDMGIGIQGLWDYTPEEAAKEIWFLQKELVQNAISRSQRNGTRFVISPVKITVEGCEDLAFEPDKETLHYLTKLVQDEIDKSINDHTINLIPNVRYNRINEENINPYDKIGMSMAKKMKIKPPFKKKKEKGNQNAMKQKKYEHEIITFDEFQKELNENQE